MTASILTGPGLIEYLTGGPCPPGRSATTPLVGLWPVLQPTATFKVGETLEIEVSDGCESCKVYLPPAAQDDLYEDDLKTDPSIVIIRAWCRHSDGSIELLQATWATSTMRGVATNMRAGVKGKPVVVIFGRNPLLDFDSTTIKRSAAASGGIDWSSCLSSCLLASVPPTTTNATGLIGPLLFAFLEQGQTPLIYLMSHVRSTSQTLVRQFIETSKTSLEIVGAMKAFCLRLPSHFITAQLRTVLVNFQRARTLFLLLQRRWAKSAPSKKKRAPVSFDLSQLDSLSTSHFFQHGLADSESDFLVDVVQVSRLPGSFDQAEACLLELADFRDWDGVAELVSFLMISPRADVLEFIRSEFYAVVLPRAVELPKPVKQPPAAIAPAAPPPATHTPALPPPPPTSTAPLSPGKAKTHNGKPSVQGGATATKVKELQAEEKKKGVSKVVEERKVGKAGLKAGEKGKRRDRQESEEHALEDIAELAPMPSVPLFQDIPALHPLRSARLLDIEPTEGMGDWPIIISTRALQSLRQLGANVKLDVVRRMLVSLSEGDFSGDNQKVLVGAARNIQIYEAKLLGDFRLVYSIDLVDFASEHDDILRCKQAIKVWGLETHATIDNRLWSAIAAYGNNKGSEYRKMCTVRTPSSRKGYFDPAIFPTAVTEVKSSVHDEADGLTDQQRLETHSVLALSKFVLYSRSVISDVLSDSSEANHIFLPSRKERAIVDHPGSALLLGRSGTGKTSCVLLKMFCLEEAYRRQPDLAGHQKLRQVFLTQSPILASRVKAYYHSLRDTLAASSLTDDQAIEMARAKQQTAEEAQDLEDLEDEAYALRGLPAKWSELGDEHFPLFLSFDTLVFLLEAEFGIKRGRATESAGQRRAFRRNGEKSASQAKPVEELLRELEVGDDVDLAAQGPAGASPQAWEHHVDESVFRSWFAGFDERLTKGLNPALCWSEIVGVIKGSEASDNTEKGHLSLEEYEGLSDRLYSTYASSRRSVYACFQRYQARKARQGDFDRSDRTMGLLRALKRASGLPLAHQMTHVYVDEAQDLLLADFSLVRHLSTNPNAWFFAGDTAQTISSGSNFRFDDLKALVYRSEVRDAKLAKRAPVQPTFFTLDLNYRSHSGITDLGRALVASLLKLFPDSIDRLPPEESIVKGPLPAWIMPRGNTEDGTDTTVSSFLFTEAGVPSGIEFGAEQCILVRDDAARERLRRTTGDIGLVMTIGEAKGLEFSEVLLLDFFSDGPVPASDWRVLLNLLDDPGVAVPSFDSIRHAALGLELRNLYVAVTRARKNLWFIDAGASGEPFRTVMRTRGIISVHGPQDELPSFGTTSTPELWKKQAQALYERSLYTQAAHCYQRAGMPLESDISLAFHERRKLRAAARRDGLDLASCSRVGEAFRKLAKEATGRQAITLFAVAADLFVLAKRQLDAAECFRDAGEHAKAATLFSELRRHDQAVDLARQSKDKALLERVSEPARFAYIQSGSLAKARSLFDNDQALLDFAADYGFEDARKKLLLQRGAFDELAKTEYEAGDLPAAKRLFHKAGDRASLIEAVRCDMETLYRLLPIGCLDDLTTDVVKRAQTILSDALTGLNLIDGSFSERRLWHQQVAVYQAAAASDWNSLQEANASGFEDWTIEINALDALLSVVPLFDGPRGAKSWITKYLSDVKRYTSLLNKIRLSLDFSSTAIARILGLDTRQVAADSTDELRVLDTSPLAGFLAAQPPEKTAWGHMWLVSKVDARKHTAAFLDERLIVFFEGISSHLLEASMLEKMCPNSALKQTCTIKGCRLYHVDTVSAKEGLVDRLEVLSAVWNERLLDVLHPLWPCPPLDVRALMKESPEKARCVSLAASDALDWLSRIEPSNMTGFLRAALLGAETDMVGFARMQSLYKISVDASPVAAVLAFLALPPGRDRNAMNGLPNSLAFLWTSRHTGGVDALDFVCLVEEYSLHAVLDTTSRVPPWHGVLLPKSLLARLHDRLRQVRPTRVPVGMQHAFLRWLASVIRDLATSEGHLFAMRGKPTPPSGTATALALRLIRVAISVAFACESRGELQPALGLVGSLNELGRSIASNPLVVWERSLLESAGLVGFCRAKSWDDLKLEMVKHNLRGQPLSAPVDPIVVVTAIPARQAWGIRGIPCLTAVKLDDLEKHLYPTTLNPLAPAFQPRKKRGNVEALEDFAEVSAEQQEAERKKEEERAAKERVEQEAASRVLQRLLPSAVKVIKFARLRRQQQDEPRTVLWTKYNEAVGGKAPAIVAGPLVEVACALQLYAGRLAKAKKELRKRMLHTLQPELVGDQMTKLNSLINLAAQHIKTLAPGSELVAKATLPALRQALTPLASFSTEAEGTLASILGGLIQPTPEASQFALGCRGILTEPQPRKLPPPRSAHKPTLNTEDLLDI